MPISNDMIRAFLRNYVRGYEDYFDVGSILAKQLATEFLAAMDEVPPSRARLVSLLYELESREWLPEFKGSGWTEMCICVRTFARNSGIDMPPRPDL